MPNVDSEMTHWEGCWFHHHKCALARLKRLERQYETLEKEYQNFVKAANDYFLQFCKK